MTLAPPSCPVEDCWAPAPLSREPPPCSPPAPPPGRAGHEALPPPCRHGRPWIGGLPWPRLPSLTPCVTPAHTQRPAVPQSLWLLCGLKGLGPRRRSTVSRVSEARLRCLSAVPIRRDSACNRAEEAFSKGLVFSSQLPASSVKWQLQLGASARCQERQRTASRERGEAGRARRKPRAWRRWQLWLLWVRAGSRPPYRVTQKRRAGACLFGSQRMWGDRQAHHSAGTAG